MLGFRTGSFNHNMTPENELDLELLASEELFALAKLAVGLGRAADGMTLITKAFDAGSKTSGFQLNDTNRKTLFKVYHYKVEPLRRALKKLNSGNLKDEQTHLFQAYQDKLLRELVDICMQITTLISEILLPVAKDSEANVFFNRMAGDFCRYLVELPPSVWQSFQPPREFTAAMEFRNEILAKGEKFYVDGYIEAQTRLSPIEPIRVELACKLSEFYHDIKRNVTKAVEYARDAYDDAIAELDDRVDFIDKDDESSSSRRKGYHSHLDQIYRNLTAWEGSLTNPA